MKIYLIEPTESKAKYLRFYFESDFSNFDNVEVVQCRLAEFMDTYKVQCVVSPANAFGLMDGGFDAAITEYFGEQLQKRVQQYIIDNFYGEQPVGTSFIIPAGKNNQFLIHTPTMQTPQKILDSRVVYQCMRTTLIVAMQNNIESIVIPMFGGKCGEVNPQTIAKMMYKAMKQLQNVPNKIDWDYAFKAEILPE